MKIFVLYVLYDHPQAMCMSRYKKNCEAIQKGLADLGISRKMWIKEYDFSKQDSFELDCD